MTKDRLENLLITALERTINCGTEGETESLIRSMGITSEELGQLGYDPDNFPSMHRAAGIEEIRVLDIEWDADDADGLLTAMVVPEDVSKPVGEWLSDVTGFCHRSYRVVCMTKEELYAEEEALSKALISVGHAAVEDFLGFPLVMGMDPKKEIENVVGQMPDDVYLEFVQRYLPADETEYVTIYVTASPYASMTGELKVPKVVEVDKDYISNHWDEISFGEPDLDFEGTDFDWEYE